MSAQFEKSQAKGIALACQEELGRVHDFGLHGDRIMKLSRTRQLGCDLSQTVCAFPETGNQEPNAGQRLRACSSEARLE
jgi:hypothetical protein